MKRYLIQLGTVTYAIKARDLLRSRGFKVKIERKTGGKNQGCGYAIVLEENIAAAVEILHEKGIKTLEIIEEI